MAIRWEKPFHPSDWQISTGNFRISDSQFAKAAKPIVEGEIGHGCVVYTGGDDVLAFLPVDTCIATARALHEKFGELLGNSTEAGKTPTLSVGIAIVHSLDPLEDILNYGRDAEHAAKKPNRRRACGSSSHP